MIPAFSSALQGLSSAETQLNTAAEHIARAPVSVTSAPSPGDSVDLSAEMVALMESRQNFDANLATLRTGDEMQRTLLNMIG
ncbi:MAG TPA: flagellar basal body rod C-terminal domain-containing protein [Bryobacteraceae bacterium]|nr:flagellar basal body rod C-terminal domain-containing protein [Bryobacteraceae bacterium]